MSAVGHARYLCSAHTRSQWPADTGVEAAFAGRSNSGKSSALNALVGANIAHTSKQPGRTRQINFFALDGFPPQGERRLADLPGYGFARVAADLQAHWRQLLADYFSTRESLRRVVLLCDVRHALTANDTVFIDYCTAHNRPFAVLLTKADKLGRTRQQQRRADVVRQLKALGLTQTPVMLFSVREPGLVDAARERLVEWLGGAAALPPNGE